MLTQLELSDGDGDLQVYWVNHERGDSRVLKNMPLVLEETGNKVWKVERVFTSLRDSSALPIKAREGTMTNLG
jgi:hypothetical protein